MKKFLAILLTVLVLSALIVLALGIVGWIAWPRTESVAPRTASPDNLSDLWDGLAQVAIPSGCPVSARATKGQVGGNSSETVELEQVEVDNRSRARLLAFEIDWDLYLNGSESCPSQLAVRYVRKPFNYVPAGGSKQLDMKFSHSSTTGFKAISGKVTYAEFADGTTCGKEQKTRSSKTTTNCREGFSSIYNF